MNCLSKAGIYLLISMFVFHSAGSVFAQNLEDDIAKGDIASVQTKIELLSPDMSAQPYVSNYLRNFDTRYPKAFSPAMLKFLINKGASVEKVDSLGLGPLGWAILTSNPVAIEILLDAKANPNAKWILNTAGLDALDYMSRRGFEERYNFSLQSVDIYFDKTKKSIAMGDGTAGYLPLELAISSNSPRIVEMLLADDANPLAQVKYLDTRLSKPKKPVYITTTVFEKSIMYLSQHNADDNPNDFNPVIFSNISRIWQATAKQAVKSVPMLPPEITSNAYVTLMSADLKAFKTEMVKGGLNATKLLPYIAVAEKWEVLDLVLRSNNLDINDEVVQTYRGDNVSLATSTLENGLSSATTFLLSHGAAIPNKKNGKDYSALGNAILRGDYQTVKVLIDAKVDLNQNSYYDNEGFYACPLELSIPFPDITKLLVDSGADSGVQFDIYGDSSKSYKIQKCSLLFESSLKGNGDAVRYYLALGLDPNGNPSTGAVPLLAAIRSGSAEVLKALLEANAKFNLRFKDVFGAPEGFKQIYTQGFDGPGSGLTGSGLSGDTFDLVQYASFLNEQMKNRSDLGNRNYTAILRLLKNTVKDLSESDYETVTMGGVPGK